MTRLVPREFGDAPRCPTAWSAAARGVVAQALAVCVAALLLCVGATTTAWGQKITPTVVVSQPNGFVVQVPNKRVVSRRSGLQLEIDTRWINNYGYRPIGVRVTSPKPTTAEHLISVRLYVASGDWWAGGVAVEQDFVMPLGSTSADTVIACPQYYAGHRCWWDVWVDGVKDKDLCVDMLTAWQSIAANPANPNTSNLKFLMLGSSAKANQTINPGADLFEALVLTAGDLPERWIEYTSFDVISLTPAELKSLAETRPKALQAILRWARSGGQLWISNVGTGWERLEEIERGLGIMTDGVADLQKRGWKSIRLQSARDAGERKTLIHLPTGASRRVRDPAVIAELLSDADWVIAQGAEPRNRDRGGRESRVDSSEWFAERQFGLGTVRVFRSMFDAAGIGVSWRMLMGIGAEMPDSTSPPTPLEVAMSTARTWESRHGMTPDAANTDFANLLVPGVGQAPVTEFRVLITLFVLAIGPGNYWLLKRTNRLHLLVLTVPLTAGVLTVGLFGYALVSDGLRTLVRVHSFTWIDQRAGEAVCWARMSYYAGLAPSRGLSVPGDVAVYPILAGWDRRPRRNPNDVERQMEWRSAEAGARDEQRLLQGWLRSRTPTQYLTIRARQSPHRLSLVPAESRLAATNELGAAIAYVAATDEQGNYFAGEGIRDRATQNLESATRVEVLAKLRPLVLENKPEMPPALADERYAVAMQRGRSRRSYRGRYGWDFSAERLGSNLAGDAIASLSGTDGQPALDLPPRSYVAITETGPEVAVGVPNARVEASFHVVMGSW